MARGGSVGAGILPTFVLPSDVEALQARLGAELGVVQTALQACANAGKFTPAMPEWASWNSLVARVEAFRAESPSWLTTKSQVDRGELLEREVASWHDVANKMGCNAGPAPMLPTQGPDLGGFMAGGLGMALLIFGALYVLKK